MIGCAAVLAALLLLLFIPAAVPAAPACHCFRDRDYDPANPGKSDEYLLATASNSLLAAAYGMPRRDIVQARMSGTAGEDLWLSAFAAQRQGGDSVVWRGARAAAFSWREVFLARRGALEPLGPRFLAALAAGAGDSELARIAAAETLAVRLGTPWEELDSLAGSGATLQETILAALIGAWSARAAPAIYSEVKAGRSAWSRLLALQGRAPQQMETEVPKTLRPVGR